MGILNETHIRRRVEHEGTILPIPEERDLDRMLTGATLDLRLGGEAYVSSKALPVILDEDKNPTITVEPGEFGILMTYEKLKIPEDVIAFIGIRFRYKLYGLINVSGFHVAPGFEGHLMFSVYNAGPRDVILRYKEPVFMMLFEELVEPTQQPYDGRFEGLTALPLDAITGLRGASVSLTRLSGRIDNVDTQLRIYGGILVTLTVGIVIVVIRWLTS